MSQTSSCSLIKEKKGDDPFMHETVFAVLKYLLVFPSCSPGLSVRFRDAARLYITAPVMQRVLQSEGTQRLEILNSSAPILLQHFGETAASLSNYFWSSGSSSTVTPSLARLSPRRLSRGSARQKMEQRVPKHRAASSARAAVDGPGHCHRSP